MNTHRVAVVGAGVIGSWHAKVIEALDGAELACVVDIDPAAADALARAYTTAAFSDLDTALEQADFDVVAVCVPSGLHADLAVHALHAGKHVIVEKPIDVTLEAADRIIAAQAATGRLATVIHQHRFDRSTRVMLDAIAGGHLGRLTSGIVSGAWWRSQSYYDSGDWRGTWELDGGGALMNQGIHTIELLVSALGRPVDVFSHTSCLAHHGIEVEDTAVAVVRFESGALGTIHGTTAAYPGVSTRLQVHGDRGSVVIENDELTFLHTSSGEREELFPGSSRESKNQLSQHEDGSAPGSGTVANDPRQLSDAHRFQYQNFLEALDGRADLVVGLEEARLAVALILSMYESARTGRPAAVSVEAACR
jgi:UDP-N-acetyl-2-amino-2-deoxyglucuronate dehydrogenase